MSHQPFETWIFAGEPLGRDEQQALHTHLDGCGQCRALADAWQQVQPLMLHAQPVAPAPGFSLRFEARLARERRQIELRQSWFIFLLSLTGAAIFLTLLVGLVVLSFESPVDWFLAVMTRLATLLTYAGAMQDIAASLTNAVPVVWWLAGLSLFALLSSVWIFSLQRLSLARRVTK